MLLKEYNSKKIQIQIQFINVLIKIIAHESIFVNSELKKLMKTSTFPLFS